MIVVDTCAILWDALDSAKLSVKAKRALDKASESHTLLISDISLWEIAMLIRKKRVEIEETPANFLRLVLSARNYQVVGISPEIADLSVNLDARINGDPADRLIVATSLIKQAALITADGNLISAGIVETIW
jgi:PIN domain nuclease of toxin-antitoxin system